MKKLKRVVIKEELVALTGKIESAIVLNQFIYWSERVKDIDGYLKEEMERVRKFSDGSSESESDIKENLANGWIYKTAAEMKEECMFEKSATTMERIMVALVDKGWLDRRRNPKYKWDKTYQYRVNLLRIQHDLVKLGYALEGYSLGINDEESNLQNEVSTVQNEGSELQNADSSLQNEAAIPEITTEITSKTISKSVCPEESEVISLIDSRTDINEHTHGQIINLLQAIKNKENFRYSIFKETLNLVDFAMYDFNYFKRSICNNLEKGFVRPAGTQGQSKGQAKKFSARTEVVPSHLDAPQPTESTPASEEAEDKFAELFRQLEDWKKGE